MVIAMQKPADREFPERTGQQMVVSAVIPPTRPKIPPPPPPPSSGGNRASERQGASPDLGYCCECEKWDRPCDKQTTQNDTVCEGCREGCTTLRFYSGDATAESIEDGTSTPAVVSHIPAETTRRYLAYLRGER